MDDPQGNKLRSASCGNQPMTAVGPSRGVGAEPFAGAVAARQTGLRPTSSPPTPTSSTSTSSLSSTTPAVLSFPAAADYAASDHLLRYPSRVGSSGFSSASSDTTDTSLTSLSLSSTSRGQSPFGFSGCGPPVAPQSAASTLVAGAGSVAATGTSLPSSPSFYEQGTASSSSSSSWTPGYPGGGRNSLSSSLAGSFFLPGPAITPEIAPIPSASPDGGADAPEYLPPSNFGMVAPGVYRSSFPKPENFAFLRSLGLKSVLTLVQDSYPEENKAFLEQEGIRFFRFSIPGNKEPFVHIPEDKIRAALACVLDVRNHPMLIHCNKGKHRTGCLVGCLRKMQHWSSTAIFDEYRRYAFPKSRNMDQQFIELFDQSSVWGDLDGVNAPAWLDQSA